MRSISKIMFSVWSLHLILSSPAAFSEALNTTGSFVVHEKDMTQYIQDQTKKWLTPNQVIVDDLSFDAPYHSSIHQVSWQGNATLNWTKSSTKNIWVFDGQTTNLTLYANTFEVHDTIPINAGGGTINVRIDAVCQNLSMSFPGQWKIHGEIPMAWNNGALAATLQNVSMTRSATVPVIKIASCQGPAGMESFLNQQVVALYNDPARVQSSLASEVQKFINTQVGTVMAMLGKPVTFDLLGAHVTFTPTTGANLTSGTWVLDGPLSLTTPSGVGTKTVPQGYTLANMSDARASGFAFATSFWSEVASFAWRGGLLNRQYKSTDIAQFQSFLSNRFAQFLVWSDLMNFNTTDLFNFTFAAPGALAIDSMTNQKSGGVEWDLSGPLYVQMDALMGKAWVPYTQFQSNTPAGVSLLATANKGALNVTYSVTNLDMNYAFRKEFLKYRQPTFGIGMGLIDQNVQSGLQNQVWSYTMPDSASPLPGYRINFKDVIFGKKTFRFEMGIQKK